MSISPEKIVIKIRLTDTETNDEDYYVDVIITLKRGKNHFTSEPTNIYPIQPTYFNTYGSPLHRFGYAGDNVVGDSDIGVSGDNTTLSDNFLEVFDDDGEPILVFCEASKKPDDAPKRFHVYLGGVIYIMDYVGSTLITTKIVVGATPFSLVANLFCEAEDGTLGAGTARLFTDPTGASTYVRARSGNALDTTQTLTIYGDTAAGRATDTIDLNGVNWVNGSVDFTRVYILHLDGATLGNITVQGSDAGAVHVIPIATTHVDNCVILDAQTEYVRYDFIAGTDLPSGRYLAVFRIKDTDEVEDDVELKITNFTDTEQRGEAGEPVNKTVTTAYAYYSEVFDITDADVTDTDALRITVTKDLVDGNTISVDYFLIIPIGDGESWPQDLAHAAMRSFNKPRRLFTR